MLQEYQFAFYEAEILHHASASVKPRIEEEQVINENPLDANCENDNRIMNRPIV